MIYNTGVYNVGKHKNRYNYGINRINDYLKGVTLARQLINYLKPKFIEECKGDIIEIGGFDNFFKNKYTRGTYLNLDLFQGSNVDLVMNAEDMSSIPDESLGAFICISVLEHSDNPDLIIREISKKLKEGGKAYISTPFLFEEHMEPQDFLRFTPYRLKKVFKENNLRIEEQLNSNSYWGCLAHFLQKKTYLKYTLGILCLLLEIIKGNKLESKFATQNDFILIKEKF